MVNRGKGIGSLTLSAPPPAPYFFIKLRPEEPKNFFGRPSPSPPYLRIWMTALPLSQGLDLAL